MLKKIICVDDSVTIRASMTSLLTALGYEVAVFPGGAEALAALQGGTKPDGMITDLNMPGMDGISLIREVRKLPTCRFLPILMLTTESQQDKREQAKAAGATGWLVKPVSMESLQAVLKKVISA